MTQHLCQVFIPKRAPQYFILYLARTKNCEPKMITIPMLHKFNCWACVTLGLCLNALLIYLVLRRSAKEMKVYSRILFQTCFIDLYMITVIALVQPIYVVYNGFNTMIADGPSKDFPHPYNFFFMMAWFWGLFFSILSNCVPFVYRYFLLCELKQMSLKLYAFLLFLLAFLVLIFVAGFTWAAFPGEAEMGVMREAHESYAKYMNIDPGSDEFSIILIMRTDSIRWLLSCAYILTVQTVCYTIIIYCGFKIKEFVKRSTESCGRQNAANDVNRQLSFILMLQTSLPVAEATFVLVCMITSMLPNKYVYFIGFGTMPMHWIPALNPLITIVVVKPYRHFCTPWIKRKVDAKTDQTPNGTPLTHMMS
ncbi:serpentine type 7TM GPCR chemoreceptor srd domain-containing protein [Ditylenchus destructor]|uniref:Serpentine type 7TM GPCR chemoreceptor srd domain-containing protein n=1 Tax=Ditylenchus destructor TaxID=166010 RepID=A0AAD4N1A9_9BILA|nr:serpentine type 7TM GPCR chemoreceptor srd domain-containing protein [Ditylenchus destructor]